MRKRLRIYVAGAISDHNPITLFRNLRIGIRVCTELILKGHAPFCPFLDFILLLQLREDEELSDDEVKEYSIAFLSDSVAVYVIPGFEKSKGTAAEIREARKMGIPTFYNMPKLLWYLKQYQY